MDFNKMRQSVRGRTLQRLEDRIKQHLSKWIRSRTNATRTQPYKSSKSTTAQPDCDSSIGQHLLKNRECAKNCEDTKFSIPTIACSQLQLRLLEATYIKIREASLCKPKEFAFSRQLFKRLHNLDSHYAVQRARFCNCSHDTIKTTQDGLQVICNTYFSYEYVWLFTSIIAKTAIVKCDTKNFWLCYGFTESHFEILYRQQI